MATVRWGLLSTADINRKLIPVIQASKRAELSAVASRNLDRAKTYANKWDIPNAFGSYQEMLNSGTIDAVYISLPNHLHAEWSIRALRAGVNVLCEKPFAISLVEVDNMIKASRETGLALTEAFMYRHHPQTKIVGDFIRSGRLGELSHAWGTFSFMIENRKDIRLVPEWGGGSLWDVGVYPLSLAQYLFGGPPLSVSGMQWLGDTGVDETFVGQLRYQGDRFCQISSSFRTDFHIGFEAVGTLGRLRISRPFTAMDGQRRLTFYPNNLEPVEIPVPEQELYTGEVEDLNSVILDGSQPVIKLDETRDHVHTALALYRSAQIGMPVEVSSIR
jgi:predicted dehydrogenase